MLGKVPGVRRQGGQRTEWLSNITGWVGQSLASVVNLGWQETGVCGEA